MKQKTVEFIFGIINSEAEKIAPIISSGLTGENYQSWLEINTLITILRMELAD